MTKVLTRYLAVPASLALGLGALYAYKTAPEEQANLASSPQRGGAGPVTQAEDLSAPPPSRTGTASPTASEEQPSPPHNSIASVYAEHNGLSVSEAIEELGPDWEEKFAATPLHSWGSARVLHEEAVLNHVTGATPANQIEKLRSTLNGMGLRESAIEEALHGEHSEELMTSFLDAKAIIASQLTGRLRRDDVLRSPFHIPGSKKPEIGGEELGYMTSMTRGGWAVRIALTERECAPYRDALDSLERRARELTR